MSALAYKIVKHLIENAPRLAATRSSPVVLVHEQDDCYRVHKSVVISPIMDQDPDLNETLSFVTNDIFCNEAKFDQASQWFTIFKKI